MIKIYNDNIINLTNLLIRNISDYLAFKFELSFENNIDKINIVVSGGNSPICLYQRFHEIKINWKFVDIWLADERNVSKDNTLSNEKNFKDSLDEKILDELKFHSIPDGDPKESAAEYSNMLKSIPYFDLTLLGIGEDGHTASLFAGNDIGNSLDSPDAIPVFNSPKPPMERVSLSMNRINRSKKVIFWVTGEKKSEIVESVLKRESKYPASLVHGIETTEIYYSR